LGVGLVWLSKANSRCAGDKPVSADQMKIAMLRAYVASLKIVRDILKKRLRTSQGNPRELSLDIE